MEIVYLLETAELFGGVKIVLQQANLLQQCGHSVKVVSPDQAPSWFQLQAEFLQTPSLAAEHLPPADLYIATFYTTLASARAAGDLHGGRAVHLCQGYEGHLTHNIAEHPAIHQAYRQPLPAITVSPHLAQLIEVQFSRPARTVPQPVDAFFQPSTPLPEGPSRPARILVTGVWEFYLKGVPLAFDAVSKLRDSGFECELIRLAQWPLGDEERARLEPDEYHHHIPPPEVAALVRSCDLLLAPSWPVEGFGLPVLEAFASGVPVVASDIPSYRDFAKNAATLVTFDDATAFASAAAELLSSPDLWRRQRAAGLRLTENFREPTVATALDAAMHWARDVEIV